MAHLLIRNSRIEEDLIDQLFNIGRLDKIDAAGKKRIYYERVSLLRKHRLRLLLPEPGT
jgi:hypothetical protein